MMVKTTRRPFDFDALVNVKKREDIGGGPVADTGKSNVEEASAGASKVEQKAGEKSDKK